MNNSQLYTLNLHGGKLFARGAGLLLALALAGAAAFFAGRGAGAQALEKTENLAPTPFRVGERLTYAISFGRFRNSGVAELAVVSRGKLEGRDAVELQSRVKTNEIVSAAFYLLDETRTTFAAADSGLPLYVRRTSNAGVAPTDTIANYLNAPTANYDLLTLVYRLRTAGGVGSLILQEDEKTYAVAAQTTAAERVRTDAGDFDATVSTVQSDYFAQKGIRDVRVSFTTDERRIPVRIRFRTAKGEFQALLAGEQLIDPQPQAAPTPVATPTPTPAPVATPTPAPTPALDNLPLSANLPFVLGETLEYRVSTGGRPVGSFVLQARARRTVERRDTLYLTAEITRAERTQSLFNVGDAITAEVNAESLAPYQYEAKFTGTLAGFNQNVRFDQERGTAVFGANQAQIPLNTHSLLSLAYAVRSFNLKPSLDKKNPADTRVSVFYESQFYIFTLRPLDADVIALGAEKVPAQPILVITGNAQLDALGLRVWLANNEKRTPLRFAIGNYQADLVTETIVPPK